MFGKKKKKEMSVINGTEPSVAETETYEEPVQEKPTAPAIDYRMPVFDPGFEPSGKSIELMLLNEEKEIMQKQSFYLPLERAIRTAAVGARNLEGARYLTALHTAWTADIYNDWQVFNE